MEFKQIFVNEMSPEDFFWLARGCEGSYDKATSKHQVDAVLKGSAFIFKVTGDMRGIFVLSIGNRELKELVMTALAGTGMIANFEEFYSKVKDVCKEAGCLRLTGFVSRPGLVRLYKNRTQMTPRATIFVEDLR